MKKNKMERFLNKSVVIQENTLFELNKIFKDNKKILHQKHYVKKDYVVYFLYLFDYLNSLNRNRDNNDEVILNTQKLIQVFHSRYKSYLIFLIDNEFILKVRNYSTDNNRSNTYKLAERFLYSTGLFMTYEIKDLTLLRKLNYQNSDLSKEQYFKNKNCLNKRPHLVKGFNKYLTMDIIKAKSEIKDFDYRKYRANIILINEFKNQIWKYSIKKETDNRLHTIITRTNKKLLKYIQYKNERLSEVDIKTSQPLFLYCILNSIYADNSETELRKFIYDFLDSELIIKLLKINLNLDELKQFGEIVVNQDFYKFLALKISIQSSGGVFLRKKYDKNISKTVIKKYATKRDLMKEVVMEVFYSSSENRSREAKIIKELFPTIFSVVDVIKNHSENKSFFSKLLQNVEAYILLDKIAKEISKKFIDIPIFSKHDSLITLESHIKLIKEEIEIHFKKLTKINNIRLEVNNW